MWKQPYFHSARKWKKRLDKHSIWQQKQCHLQWQRGKKMWKGIYWERVTTTGAAAIADILQLMSGLTSNRISLLISTVWSPTDNSFFCSRIRKQITGTASSVAKKTCNKMRNLWGINKKSKDFKNRDHRSFSHSQSTNNLSTVFEYLHENTFHKMNLESYGIVTLDAAFLAPLACHILRKDTRFGKTVSGATPLEHEAEASRLESINSAAHTECCILPEKKNRRKIRRACG